MKAIVNFRTLPNGSFSYMRRGMRRGYYRVLIVQDETGPMRVGSRNVLQEFWTGRDGIDGVTARSSYYLGDSHARAQSVADQWNAAH